MSAYEIIHGDCIPALQALPARSVDAIVTDPPYCSGGSTEATRKSATSQGLKSPTQWFAGDNMTTAGLVWLLRAVAFEAERVLVPGGSLLAFCDWRMWANLAPALESGGLRLQNMVVWDKGSPGLGNGFKPTHELVAHLCNGPGKFHALNGSNVVRFGRVRGEDKDHPTEKPVEVMQALVRVVAPRGGLVVDPFCGSGSTGVAAIREGRRFLGMERDPEYSQVARDRLAAAREQYALPEASAATVEQAALFAAES